MFLPYQEIVIWTIIIAFIVTLAHRLSVDPEKMRQLKKDMKYMSKKSREAQKKGDTKKANEYMSDMMSLNKKQFGMMKKPLAISFLVYIVALYTLFLPYGQVIPITGQKAGGITLVTDNEVNQLTRTGVLEYAGSSYQARVTVQNPEGENKAYNLTIDLNGNGDLSDDRVLNEGDVARIGDSSWKVHSTGLESTFFVISVDLPFTLYTLILPPTRHIDWIWWYILCVLAISTIFRKMMGVE